MNWLKRLFGRIEPVTYDRGNALGVNTKATAHTVTPPVEKAEVIDIKNPRLYLKRQAIRRRAKAAL